MRQSRSGGKRSEVECSTRLTLTSIARPYDDFRTLKLTLTLAPTLTLAATPTLIPTPTMALYLALNLTLP